MSYACVDRVACGAGYLGHDVAVFADEGVDDRALACVRASYYGEAWYAVLYVFLHFGFELCEHKVEQVARAAAGCRRDALRLAESECVELSRVVYLVVVVGLVSHKNHGELGAAEDCSHVLVPVGESGLHVNDEEHHVGLLGCHDNLLADSILEDVVAINDPSAGVYYRKLASVPLALAVLAVACGAAVSLTIA